MSAESAVCIRLQALGSFHAVKISIIINPIAISSNFNPLTACQQPVEQCMLVVIRFIQTPIPRKLADVDVDLFTSTCLSTLGWSQMKSPAPIEI